MNRYLSRKFLIAALFGLTGCVVFAFTAKLTGSEFITLAGLVLGTFTAGDAALNYIHKRNSEEPPK